MRKLYGLFVLAAAICAVLILRASPVAAATVSTNDNAGSYTGTWTTENTSSTSSYYYSPAPWGAYNNDLHASGTTGSYVTFTFTGNSITLLGTKGDSFGKADVSIDGGAATTVDYYIPALEHAPTKNIYSKGAVFIKDGLSDGTHTIKVTVKGQKNPSSTGYAVNVDYIVARDTNRAKGVTGVTASNTFEGYGWSIGNIVDGQSNSVSGALGWSTYDNIATNHSEWLQIDLGETNFIDRVDLHPRNDSGVVGLYFPVDLNIQVSKDGTEWTTVAAKAGIPQPSGVQTYRFMAMGVRYIKVTGTSLRPTLENGTDTWYRMQLAEVEARFDDYHSTGTTGAAAGATYYVSSSGGSDSNNGTSSSTPWKTLAKASSMIYSGGNSVLLKKGDTWTGQTLSPRGNGTSANPIVVGAYGSGAKPKIVGDKGQAAAGIEIYNNHGYKIQGLEISGGIFGIEVLTDLTYGHDYLYIDDVYVHDIEGPTMNTDLINPYYTSVYAAGIAIISLLDPSTEFQRAYSNITITNSVVSQCDTGIMFQIRDKPFDYRAWNGSQWYFTRDTFHNVTISNTGIYRSYRSAGLALFGITEGTVDNVLVDETGVTKGMWWGVAAVQTALDENLTVKNSELKRTYRIATGSPDGEGFDFESGDKNVTLLNTYVHDNEGPGVMFYGENGGWRSDNEGNTVDGCYFYNNGVAGYGDDSKAVKNWPKNTGIVKNSVFKLNFSGQAYDSSPVVFDGSNRVYNADGSTAFTSTTNKIVSTGATVTASSTVEGYGWARAFATDGLTSSLLARENANGWTSTDSLTTNHTEWLQIDLGSAKTVSEVDLWSTDRATNYFPIDFTIQLSTDGMSWTTVVTRTGYAQPSQSAPKQAFTFTSQPARYVKITGTSLRQNAGENNWYRMQFAEAEVLKP